MQTILRRLIWAFTASYCLFYGTLGINGLILQTLSDLKQLAYKQIIIYFID